MPLKPPPEPVWIPDTPRIEAFTGAAIRKWFPGELMEYIAQYICYPMYSCRYEVCGNLVVDPDDLCEPCKLLEPFACRSCGRRHRRYVPQPLPPQDIEEWYDQDPYQPVANIAVNVRLDTYLAMVRSMLGFMNVRQKRYVVTQWYYGPKPSRVRVCKRCHQPNCKARCDKDKYGYAHKQQQQHQKQRVPRQKMQQKQKQRRR